jgi:beta-1,2-mannobiose phosphorylase / 1,2-beta-oligomannan phosphorylase
MPKKRHSPEQIIGKLRDAAATAASPAPTDLRGAVTDFDRPRGIEPMNFAFRLIIPTLCLVTGTQLWAADAILRPDKLQAYVERFNAADNELYQQYVPNAKAAEFLRGNVPLLDCPDAQIEQTYYFRWWTYRKHVKETPDGFVIAEFLPTVGWAGKHAVEVHPLAPDDWEYFCLDNVAYHGRTLTILWDKSGQRYRKGQGLRVLADGCQIAAADGLRRVTGQLPPTNSTRTSIAAGWVKSPANPVLGGALGTCFDVALLKEVDSFRMWFSWRPKRCVALVESKDGIHWSEPLVVLGPNAASGWEDAINRPVVVRRSDGYHMWFTGQAKGGSRIGYATSSDGKTWKRARLQPVLSPDAPWEKVAVMCPHVIWDEAVKQYRMWYSGGEQYEPNAIGYATSADGATWKKWPSNPIFAADPKSEWERHKVTACQVLRQGDWHVMFYIGFRNENYAQIGIARSRDGISGWQRYPANPILRPDPGAWDADACYKPFAILDGDRWLLWYNGRNGRAEQIGLATHLGADLGFDQGPHGLPVDSKQH